MSDLDKISLCHSCNKLIRETYLPFIGRPVALSCGHVVHSTCMETDKQIHTCKKCEKPVEFFTPLKINVSEESKILDIDKDWDELVKQKMISLELDRIGKGLDDKLAAVYFELDMLEKENENCPEYLKWKEAVAIEEGLEELLKFYENYEIENIESEVNDENDASHENESFKFDQNVENKTVDYQTDEYYTCQEEEFKENSKKDFKEELKKVSQELKNKISSTEKQKPKLTVQKTIKPESKTNTSLSEIYCPICFLKFNDKIAVNKHLKLQCVQKF